MSCGIYYPTWNSPWVSDAEKMDLSKLNEEYVGLTHVYLSFCKPDLSYSKGQRHFSGTGLEFSMTWQVVYDAIKILQSKGVKVLLAVGGASYWSNFKNLNVNSLFDLCNDLDVDGIDVDYEVMGQPVEFTSAVFKSNDCRTRLQKIKNRKILLTIVGFSVGAFTSNGGWGGLNLDVLAKAGDIIDIVNLMAYDAGPPSDYDPIKAFDAYRRLYNGVICMGFEIGTPGWGGYNLEKKDIIRNAGYVAKKDNGGIFVWCHRKSGDPTPRDVFEIYDELSRDGNTGTGVDGSFIELNNFGNFELNGKVLKLAGINAYWMGLHEDYTYPTFEQIEEMFIVVKRLGGNCIRCHTAGHSSGTSNSLRPSNNNLNNSAWRNIDYIFNMARKYDVKLIAPLTDCYAWYNGNYGDFCKTRGVEKKLFWTLRQVVDDFKEYIRLYLDHYNPLNECFIKDDPCLAMIELGNELGNIRPSHGSINIPTREWLTEVSSFVKDIDKNHLVLCPTDESLGQSDEFRISSFDCFRNDYYWADYARLYKNSRSAQAVDKCFIVSEFDINLPDAFLSTMVAENVDGSIMWGIYPHQNGIKGGAKLAHNDGYTFHYSKDNDGVMMKMARHFAAVLGTTPPKVLVYGNEEVEEPKKEKNIDFKCSVCGTEYVKFSK